MGRRPRGPELLGRLLVQTCGGMAAIGNLMALGQTLVLLRVRSFQAHMNIHS